MKTKYKIWCEWDMGEGWEDVVFPTIESAEEQLKKADWEQLVSMTYEEVRGEGLVEIEEVYEAEE